MKFDDSHPLYKLKEIAAILRSENGCAWDKEQNPNTLRPYLIEETYELYDAIESGDQKAIKEELGDLLYQIYAHAQIFSETNSFSIDDVAEGISQKLIRRHPHVFGNENNLSAEEVSERWEKIKKVEKSERTSILEGVPKHLPGLLKAYRIQQKAARIGFDWEKIDDVLLKLDEEIGELKEVINEDPQPGKDKKELLIDEAGDILFSIVNVLRYLKINPEEAIARTNNKFMKRFQYIENHVSSEGKELEHMTLKELDVLWDKAKSVLG